MTTTLATLRQELSDEIDDKWASTVTTLLAADNYVIDTALAQFPDNTFIDQWVLITAQNNAAQKRRIKAFTSSTYKLETYGSAWTLDTVKATYEIHQIDPDKKTNALNRARVTGFPSLAQTLDDQTLTTHSNQRDYTMPTTFVGSPERVYLGDPVSPDIEENLLDNADFEEWTGSAPDHWDTSSEITTAKEDDPYFVYSGEFSCKCTTTLLTGYLYQTVANPTDYLGRRMSFNIWVYCLTASRVQAQIVDDSGGAVSSYHAGGGWELLTVSYNVYTGATFLKAGIKTTAGAVTIAFYEDDCIFWTGARSPGTEWMPQHDWNVDSSILHFENTKTANRPIRLVGYGYLSAVATDASTMEVDDDIYKRFLYAEAAVHLYQQLKQSAATSLTPLYEGQYNYWLNESYSRRRSCARVFQHHIKIPGWSG